MAEKGQTKDVQEQTNVDTNLSDEDLEQAAGGTTSDPPDEDDFPGGTGPTDPGNPFED